MVKESVVALPFDRLSPPEAEPEPTAVSVSAPDVVNFVRMLARCPLLANSNARIMKRVTGDLREKRSQDILTAFRPRRNRRSLKRKHHSGLEEELSDSVTDEEGNCAPRRSTRAKVQLSNGNKGAEDELFKSRGNPPKMGPAYQATVPRTVVSENKRTPDMVHVASELVFTASMCTSQSNISQFLNSVDEELCCRDGFGLSPAGQEAALLTLADYNGDRMQAQEAVLPIVGTGTEFPGAGAPWTNEEKCRYVRAVGETAKDFSFISRNVLKNRPTKELVVMYYTYYKQQKLQHGRATGGHIFDTGRERPFVSRLGPQRMTNALRYLAKTACDGFPADRRLVVGVKEHRANVRRLHYLKEPRNGTRSGRQYNS